MRATAALAALAVCALSVGCGATVRVPVAAPAHTTPRVAAKPPRRPAHVRCFGAAAADRLHPCSNPRLALAVVPSLREAAALVAHSACPYVEHRGLVHACFWGAPKATARRTVALIGDSHASVWRPALRAVVRAQHWRAVSISRAGCPLTLAQPLLPGRSRSAGCRTWNRQVQRFVARHPAISIVFTAAHRSRVRPRPGLDVHASQIAGYQAAMHSLLLEGVGHVVVLRDTPRNAPGTVPCIQAAVATARSPGLSCPVPRAYALRHDPLALAAARMRSPRVDVLNLTGFMCGPVSCYPVVGGALVLRDRQHMSDSFSRTLGPYLLRAVDRLLRRWGLPSGLGSA